MVFLVQEPQPPSPPPPFPASPPPCRELPSSISGLVALQELSLQGNPHLALLPEQLGALPALKDLSLADCSLAALPSSLATAPALETLSLYGNRLHGLPPRLLQVRPRSHRCSLPGWRALQAPEQLVSWLQ